MTDIERPRNDGAGVIASPPLVIRGAAFSREELATWRDVAIAMTGTRGQGHCVKVGALESMGESFDLRMQAGQFAMDGLPDDVKVNFVVTVRNLIAHGIHHLPWNVVMLRGEGRRYAPRNDETTAR